MVRWLKGDTVVAQRRSTNLIEAKQTAAAQLPVQKVRKGATAATVTDDDGTEYLRIG
jgi:hypothetical protein